MDYFTYLVSGYSAITGLLWLIAYWFVLRQIYAPQKINQVNAPEPSSFPSLSVLVPACNEADKISPALQSILKQDYPNLEVIAINDRSTDQTGEIIEQLATQYDNLRTIHIETLPDGWLGKTYALKKGYEIAKGDWVLATDADVCYKKLALRSIMAVALHHDRDHVSCIPKIKNNGFLHETAFDGFVSLLFSQQNIEGVSDPESDDYFGFGAFNMFRRKFFEQTRGFAWLRMEVTDDMGIARMLRDHGAKQGIYYAFDQLELQWYGSLGKMIKGLEKKQYWCCCPLQLLERIFNTHHLAFVFNGTFSRFIFLVDLGANTIVSSHHSQHTVQCHGFI